MDVFLRAAESAERRTRACSSATYWAIQMTHLYATAFNLAAIKNASKKMSTLFRTQNGWSRLSVLPLRW